VEWVPGPRGARYVRPLLGFLSVGLWALVVALMALGQIPFNPPLLGEVFLGMLACLLTGAALQYAYPLNRRVGLTSEGMIWDTGVFRYAYSWDNLGWETPTRLVSNRVTRADVWLRLNLTDRQAARVRGFIDQMTPNENPPSWIARYDPR
jgi:hypothetical protein